MDKLNHYITMILFTVMFILGLQIPAFVDEYTKRVDAQLVEASRALKAYKQIADKYHDGKMQGLIELHRNSNIPSIQEQAEALQQNVDREMYLTEHLNALNKNIFSASITVMFDVDEEIYDRTFEQFNMSVQFTKLSLIFAIFLAVLSCVLYELSQWSVRKLSGKAYRRIRHQH